MKLFWEMINIPLSGAVAVHILHFTESPSYLVLAIGWLCLLGATWSLATVLNAMFGIAPTPQICGCWVCSKHRQEVSGS